MNPVSRASVYHHPVGSTSVAPQPGGKTNKEIAAALCRTEQTVNGYMSNALQKTGRRCRAELASRMGPGVGHAGQDLLATQSPHMVLFSSADTC